MLRLRAKSNFGNTDSLSPRKKTEANNNWSKRFDLGEKMIPHFNYLAYWTRRQWRQIFSLIFRKRKHMSVHIFIMSIAMITKHNNMPSRSFSLAARFQFRSLIIGEGKSNLTASLSATFRQSRKNLQYRTITWLTQAWLFSNTFGTEFSPLGQECVRSCDWKVCGDHYRGKNPLMRHQ